MESHGHVPFCFIGKGVACNGRTRPKGRVLRQLGGIFPLSAPVRVRRCCKSQTLISGAEIPRVLQHLPIAPGACSSWVLVGTLYSVSLTAARAREAAYCPRRALPAQMLPP